METTVSPRQAARAIGSSEASLKRWCDKGIIRAVRTVGGHRRIAVASVLDFLRETGRHLADPEVLGLPTALGQGPNPAQRGLSRVTEAIETGSEDGVRALVMELYLAGRSICEICDEFIAPAFDEIGTRWEHGDVEVYQERRGVEICTRSLLELRSACAIPPLEAPYALGASLEHDPYSLATTMAEVVLREAGWRAESIGVGIPLDTLQAAVQQRKPRLVWVSFSVANEDDDLLQKWADFYRFAATEKVAVAVGGRALTSAMRKRMSYSTYCDGMSHLVDFAKTLNAGS